MPTQTDRCRLAEDDRAERIALLWLRKDRHQRSGTALLHLYRREKHVQRPSLVETVHQHTEELRIHVVDLAIEHHKSFGSRFGSSVAKHCAQDVRLAGKIAISRAIAGTVYGHRRHRSE